MFLSDIIPKTLSWSLLLLGSTGRIETKIHNLICETQEDQVPVHLSSLTFDNFLVFFSLLLILCLSSVVISLPQQ